MLQAACGCGVPHGAAPPPSFARFWVHNGFVNVDAEKMSKCAKPPCLPASHRAEERWFVQVAGQLLHHS
jgi:hypothetical protein